MYPLAFVGMVVTALFILTPIVALSVTLPGGEALFETSLQSRISETDTSMTLVENELRDGTSLSGYACFTIDEGRSDAEFVCGTASGTSVTNLERGISPKTGTSSVSSLKFAHRRGANVKQTDFPLLQRLRNILNNDEVLPGVLRYASTTATSTVAADENNLVTVGLLNYTAFNGAQVVSASESVRGVVELANRIQQASSTPVDNPGVRLVLQASNATSSCNTTATTTVVVTGANAKINSNCIDTAPLSFNWGTTTASSSISTNNEVISAGSIPYISIPGNTLQPGDIFHVTVPITSLTCSSAGVHKMAFRYGSSTVAATTTANCAVGAASNPYTGSFEVFMHAVATSSQYIVATLELGSTVANVASSTRNVIVATTTTNSANDQYAIISAQFLTAATVMDVGSGWWEIIRRRF